jgi:Methyltransferase domain
MHISYHHL